MVVLSFFVWRRRDWARPWLRDFPASFNRKRSVSHSISRLFERNWRSTPQLLLEIPDPVQKVIFDWEHLHSIINATCRGKPLYQGPEADMRVVLLHTKDVKRRRKTRDKWSIRFLKMHFPNLPEKTLRSEVTRDKWGFPK